MLKKLYVSTEVFPQFARMQVTVIQFLKIRHHFYEQFVNRFKKVHTAIE